MLKAWKWYQRCMSLHPVKTQVASSGILWGVGDIAAQSITYSSARKRLQIPDLAYRGREKTSHTIWYRITFLFVMTTSIATVAIFSMVNLQKVKMGEDQDFKIDWKRTAITSMFGFGFVGPIGHLWYEGLDRFIRQRLLLRAGSVPFVASKVAIDCLIFGPFELFVFFSHMGFSTGKNVAQVKEDLKRDFIPALVVESGAWPFVQVVNFRYVPVRYQLLYVNLFCLLDSVFLSWLEQQKDASWKQLFSSSPSSKEQGHGEAR